MTAPGSIPELARALKYDVNLIYEYVYTNIEYIPTYGLRKGALGTLLDGRGNDMDQAALLVALLRESGYTASYIYGLIQLSAAELGAYFGVDVTDTCPLVRLLTNGGIPVNPPPDCAVPFVSGSIPHTWVSATGGSLGSTVVALDPSYKIYASTGGMDLATATGYSQSTFLSSAGGTVTSNSIQNVNQGNIATALKGYANNLVSHIRATDPTATTRDVLGGNYIQPLTQPYTLPVNLPYPSTVLETWIGEVPAECRVKLRVQIGGIDKVYYTDQIYGHRLSVVYNASKQPVLYLDGVAQGTGTANANTISYSIDFPFCFETTGSASASCGTVGGINFTDIFTTQNVVQAIAGYTYAIVTGWDFTGRGMVEFHRRQLQINRAKGDTDDSEPVLGETLNLLGYSWLAQVSGATAINDRIIGTQTVLHCSIGVVAQVSGPYIDMPGHFVGISSLTNDLNRPKTSFFASGGALSALEWGVLDQSLEKAGVGAVSTVKLIDIANAQNLVIYDATSANYWSTVRPALGFYSPSDLAGIDGYINSGYRIFLPQRGNLTQGIWTGAGYIATGTAPSGLTEISYKISSNLKGGYSDFNVEPQFYIPELLYLAFPVPPLPQVFSFDPIDLFTGAFLYDHDDLSIGSTDFPHGLSFRRSYNSNNLYSKGPLGPGWTHGFAINATSNSDGLKGMGQDSPIDGAAFIAAAYVAQDLFSDATKPLAKVIVATLAQKWLMDRLIANTVDVTMGPQAEQFVLLADGGYNPQLGSTSRLSLDNGAYTLRTKDGTTLAFDGGGDISTWKATSGVTVSFAYDASSPRLLTSVTNTVGRSLTLAYDGSKQLTSVTDNASPARSVAYAYDDKGNLASFTEPLGNVTTFAYTWSGGTAPPGLLQQIFYPSTPNAPFVTNSYDTLGRVAAQENANGATWKYFFAGYRSEEDDPQGTQHVLYYNPRGKALFDIQDAAGLNLITKFAYDGLDRLVSTTLPEGNGTTYTYATAPNPWANNVASVTRTAKPGSPLSPSTTTATYDSIFNKPTSVTDPLGRVTAMTYDPWTGNLLSVTADTATLEARSSFTYNGLGLPLTATDPLGVVTQYAYDSFGNRTSTVADAGPGRLNQTTTIAYNARGDAVSVTDPRGNVTISTYDAARRLLTTTTPATAPAPGGIVTTNTYDADNRVTQVQQAVGGSILRTSSSTWTRTGKVATATDPKGNVMRYAYDLLDRAATVTDAAGRVTRFGYDVLSRRTQTFNSAVQATSLLTQAYTANGKVASLTDANTNTTNFAYDGFDRLVTTTYPLGSTETFTYDAVDNPLARKTRAGPTSIFTFAYDTLNRLITKTPPSGPVVSYSYDLAGRLRSVSDTSAAIAPAAAPGGVTTAYTTSFTYDALNRPIRTEWGQVAAAAAPAAGSAVTFGHAYNAVNQRVGQTVSDNSWIAYPTGAPSTVSYAVDSLNRYTSVGGVAQSYDGNSNLTGDGTYSYNYDPENRLVSAAGAGNSAAYAYDAQGRRKTRTVNGTTTVSVTDTQNREVLEYDGSNGQVLRWYAYGLGTNAVLGQVNVPADTRTTPVPDLLGSVVGSMEASTGTLSKFTYLPYGGSATAATPFGFTGQRFEPEAGGLYYYRARHYSPARGRFMQADPIGYAAGINLYAYVGNDPLNLSDPSGLDTYFGQFTAAYVWMLGGVVGSGMYYTEQNSYGLPDIGFFGSAGPAVGLNVGVGASVGYNVGPLSSFQGRSISIDASLGPVGGSVAFSPSGKSSSYQGATLGANIGVPAMASGSLSSPTTKTFGVMEDIFIPMLERLGLGSFPKPQTGTSTSVAPGASILDGTPAAWPGNSNASESGTRSLGGPGFTSGFDPYPSYSK